MSDFSPIPTKMTLSRVPRRARGVAALLIAATLTSCSPAPSPAPSAAEGPRLVLLIVVDQLSQEYLVRFRPLLTGGLAFLLDTGVVFTDAHHEHAHTVTGAGHATLTTGRFPRHSGIISNRWYDRATGEEVYCVQGERYARSPANLMASTIGDWLKDIDASSKVFAASAKDRSAILLGGHGADAALWYDTGEWTTSGYYTEPEWLAGFNDRAWLDRYFGTLWEPLPVEPQLLDQLDVVELDEGIYQRAFPYAFGGRSLAPTAGFYDDIQSSPFVDAYLAELARTMIREEQLGADRHPDFLGLGFSALDYVGHDFGPNSREVLDTILRLDRTLEELFAFIDGEVGLENVVIGMSSDHGVAPLPAYRRSVGLWGERAGMEDHQCFQQVGRALQERYGDYDWLQVGMYLDTAAISAAGIDRTEIEQRIVDLISACDGVQRVWTGSELSATPAAPVAAEDDTSRYRQLFANSYHPQRSPDFEVQYAPYYLDRVSVGTTHGSPHPYDTWVPMIVRAPGLEARLVHERARTVDLAPTVAAIMGIVAPDQIDGVDRTPATEDW